MLLYLLFNRLAKKYNYANCRPTSSLFSTKEREQRPFTNYSSQFNPNRNINWPHPVLIFIIDVQICLVISFRSRGSDTLCFLENWTIRSCHDQNSRLAPVVKLNYAYSKVFFSLISQYNDGWVCSKGWKKRQLWWENNVWIISLGQNILIKSMNIRQGASLPEQVRRTVDSSVSISDSPKIISFDSPNNKFRFSKNNKFKKFSREFYFRE